MPRSGTIKPMPNSMMTDLYDDTGERRWGRPILLGLVISLFVGLLGYSYYAGMQSSDGVVIKTLYPETPYTRIKPEDPAGMTVEYQDMEIYERVDPNGVDLESVEPSMVTTATDGQTVEEVVEGTETTATDAPYPPLRVLPKFSKPISAKPAAEEKPTLGKTELVAKVAATKPKPVKKTESTSAEKQQVAPPISLIPNNKTTAAVAATAKPVVEKAAASGSYLLQLASFGSEPTAQAGWKRLKAKHSSLGSLNPRIEKTTIEGRGDFYRLQAGSWSTKGAATEACKALKQGGQDCLVIKR